MVRTLFKHFLWGLFATLLISTFISGIIGFVWAVIKSAVVVIVNFSSITMYEVLVLIGFCTFIWLIVRLCLAVIGEALKVYETYIKEA